MVVLTPPEWGTTRSILALTCVKSVDGGARESSNPNRQIRSLVLCVDLVGSRRIWPAQVGCLVDPDGSRRVPSDRLDDQTDDQVTGSRAFGPHGHGVVTHQMFRLVSCNRESPLWTRPSANCRYPAPRLGWRTGWPTRGGPFGPVQLDHKGALSWSGKVPGR